jgi:hypothetical protein
MKTSIRTFLGRTFLVVSVLVLAPAIARAGIADSPLPLLGGIKSNSLFSVTGVVSAAGLGTFFSCTNPSPDETVAASVELFVDAGGNPCNDAASVAVTLSPGETVLFATQNNIESSFFSSQPLTAVDMFLSIGSARIISTGKTLVCDAFVADVYNSPPSSMMKLNLIYRNKPKGD